MAVPGGGHRDDSGAAGRRMAASPAAAQRAGSRVHEARGMLVSGFGMVYVISGRLNADGFVFATLLDRPLVPVVVAILWYMNSIPGALALAFAVEDLGSFLWTLSAWRAEERTAQAPG